MKRKAYAKINLILDVFDKDETDYHNVDFLMSTVDLYDVIDVEKDELNSDSITVSGHPELSNQNNLAYKALKLFKEKYKINDNFKIIIEKNIPISGGMAGGSTDAATTLLLLNELTNTKVFKKELEQIATKLGMDVPFCLYSTLARATGKGEKIEILDSEIPASSVLIITLNKELSTQRVYQNYHYKEEAAQRKSIPDILKIKEYDEFYNNLRNDLQKISERLEPKIFDIENEIKNSNISFEKYIVSGSGPTLIVFDQNIDNLEKLQNHLNKRSLNIKTYISKVGK